jgi:hypothetical protein
MWFFSFLFSSELDGYHTLTEESVDTIIADSQLPASEYDQIKKHVIGMFSSSHASSSVDGEAKATKD